MVYAISSVLLLGYITVGQTQPPPQARGWTPEQWAFILPIVGLQVVAIITAMANRGKARDVEKKVEAVHQEIRPPSNGTTTGAQTEFVSQSLPWIFQNLLEIHEALGTKPQSPPPVVPEVTPPERPPEPPLAGPTRGGG